VNISYLRWKDTTSGIPQGITVIRKYVFLQMMLNSTGIC